MKTTWKDNSADHIQSDIYKRNSKLSHLQMKRDALQKALFDNPGDDYLLGKILKINAEITKAKKPILERELFLRQGIRRRP